MLHCPPSRIDLTNSDIADFERKLTTRREAARLAQVQPAVPHLSAGPSRLARLSVVQADDNAARKKALSCSSQAVTCSNSQDEETAANPQGLRTTLLPPSIRTSDYDNDAATIGRLDGIPIAQQSTTPRVRLQRHGGSVPYHRESFLPLTLDGQGERRLRPTTTYQTTREVGPTHLVARSARPFPRGHDFILHEDSSSAQAYTEAQHLHSWHAANPSGPRTRLLRPSTRDVSTRVPYHPVPAAAGRPASGRPALPLNLNPGAPAFIPRTRFGSGTGGSEDNIDDGARVSQYAGQGTRVSSTQSTSNLRVRSSFERNSQQPHPRHASYGGSNPINMPSIRPNHIQYRRRSHTSDQNANMSAIYSSGERYPALQPPSSIPAPRRSSGAHRQVIFPPRGSSQQHLVDIQQRAIPIRRPTQSSDDQRRSSTQSKSSSPFVPDVSNELRVLSAASSSSHSTPNLFQATSPAPLPHSRSSSNSWDRYVSHQDSRNRVPSMVSAASGISGSSDGRAHRIGHVPFEESLLSRHSPLDELLLDFRRLFPDDGRPRSVGQSFSRPLGSPIRISLLSGDIFRQDDSPEQCSARASDHIDSGEQPLRVANDSSFSEDDAVALALALPSPNMPPSSPMASISPRSHASILPAEMSHSTPRPSITQSGQSISGLTQAQDGTTSRVNVYDDRRSPRTQPQTPADISRSTRQNRTRATTMSRQEVGTIAGGLFSPVIPERRPHRPYTYPAGTSPSMIDNAAMPGRPGIVGGQNGRPSWSSRSDLRGSGSIENDVEGSLAGLDADRRTWMERREQGTLDITPPREGRFERFLR